MQQQCEQWHLYPREQFKKEIECTLNSDVAQRNISQEMKDILHNENPRIVNFYLLPKIHKKNNLGRPIIISIGSLAKALSAFVDEMLRQYSKKVPSYIKKDIFRTN